MGGNSPPIPSIHRIHVSEEAIWFIPLQQWVEMETSIILFGPITPVGVNWSLPG